jgi:hypothetical protein
MGEFGGYSGADGRFQFLRTRIFRIASKLELPAVARGVTVAGSTHNHDQ